MEFEDDDLNNIILNLRQRQDIWHLTVPALMGSVEIHVNNNASYGM